MISYFQPIATFPSSVDGWGLVAQPGNETNATAIITGIDGGPSAGFVWPLLDVPKQSLTAEFVPAYGGDLYERLHISVATIALGNVIGLQQRTVNVWNAFTRAQILGALVEDNTEGIDLTGGPGALPYQFAPLEETSYTLTVTTSGPPTIDATFTWDFSPYDLVLRVTGSRVTAWSFIPDWTNGVIERIEWKTDVLQTYNANEQRSQLRVGPRKSYEFEAFFEDKARRYAESIIWGWGARTWALPIWPDGQDLVNGLPSGSTAIAISTTARDYAAGSLAVILQDAFTFEVIEVESVAANSLGLKRPTTRAWQPGARIYPARLGRIMDQVSIPRWSGQASGARVVFDVVGPVDYTANAGATTYRGRPVLTTKPEWSGGFDLDMTRKLAEIDNITGGLAYDDESGVPSARQRMRWTLPTKADQDTYRRLLYALAGRAKSIWVPTWTDDLKLVALIASGASSIDVEWSAYTQQIAQAVGRRDIRIELRSGQVLYRRITGSQEVDADTERLALDTSIGQTIQVADVIQISFMALSRLDADAIEFAHWTGDVAQSATVFRSFNDATV